jgi:membrane associated rhomboid family serine protease
MDSTYKRIARRFSAAGILSRLLAVNAAVFLIVLLTDVAFTLFGAPELSILPWLQLPSAPQEFVLKPWTLLTYMFTHFDVWHILFNMLILYLFGQIFTDFFNPRRLGSVYLLGGIAGGALYMLVYNVVPYFAGEGGGQLVGASASVMATVFAVAVYRRDYEIGLMLIGRIKIIYVALAVLLIDVLGIAAASNAGGHIAHLGGASAGAIFAVCLKAGKDITAPVSFLLDRIAGIGKRRQRLKVTYLRRSHKPNAAQPHPYNASPEIDNILDKLKQSGYSSLSPEEKRKLFDVSKKMNS